MLFVFLFRGDDMKTVEEYIEIFKKRPQALVNVAEFNVLRPNDSILWYGKEGYRTRLTAVKIMLDSDEYKDSKLREYYYDMMNHQHKYQLFEHWKKWGRI